MLRGACKFVVPAIALALAGCSSNPFIVEVTDCPAVAFVKYANTVTRFTEGTFGNYEDVAFTAALSDLEVECRDLGQGVTTDISFTILAREGPALRDATVEVPYFVVIAREGDELRAKDSYVSRLTLSGEYPARGAVRENLVHTIPTDELADAHLYEVLIGFSLSEDEAAYNVSN